MAYPYVSDHEVRVISKHFGDPMQRRVDTYVERGGYEALKKAFELGPDGVVDVVKASGLRGRGGYTVDLNWADGNLTGATIRSKRGGTVGVRLRDKVVGLDLSEGGVVRLGPDLQIVD